MSTETKRLKFPRTKDSEFVQTLQQRVNAYFTENNISKYSDYRMVLKTVAIIAMYVLPYLLIVTGVVENVWLSLVMWAFMGLGMSGIGMSVMHDANHGAYSKNPRVNKYIGNIMNLIGGNDRVWRLKHNVLHHTYTNIEGEDEDIDVGALFRFSPHQERHGIHKYQHIYAWPLYCLMSLMFATYGDFTRIFRYRRKGIIRTDSELKSLLWNVIGWKAVYYAYIMALPLIVSPIGAGWIILGFLVMHFVCGLMLSLIFQAAHVMPECEFPEPAPDGQLEEAWVVHQLMTTTNFAPKSRIFSWFVGGLNYQVEHHLFSNICHVHYRKLSAIVSKTAEEFGHKYKTERSFFSAIVSHMRLLQSLGRQEQIQMA
ncbi:MAG: acyl-CoA desaturase [Bacteroidetes bacterium]|jgi:linoleoyl-CoA desaturase|nr:acyl-CoA desaturase [Bacteroidota bacterium]MDA0973766.1 acyl-CoA desaturase [Bacteroidota bacterium]